MTLTETFALLWTDYLEGELDEDGISQLQSLLAQHPELRAEALKSYQLHRMLGVLAGVTSAQDFVQATMKRVPLESARFVTEVLDRIHFGLGSSEQNATVSRAPLDGNPVRSVRWYQREWLRWCIASAACVLMMSWMVRDRTRLMKSIASIASKEPSVSKVADADVRFTSTARSKFLGEYSPAVGSVVAMHRDYVLTSGSIQLKSPLGAETIIDAPAVFQITSAEKLRISIGKCSVYAPKGAEGYVVETPNATIVDRGTRFAVRVSETASTEVHVVEGAADLYRRTNADKGMRMVGKEARSILNDSDSESVVTEFQPRLFRSGMPDRVVGYKATESAGPDKGVENLTSLQVQRGGVLHDYSAEELLRCDLIWFCNDKIIIDDANTRIRHLASKSPEIENRSDVFSDLSLNTGAINPGGSVEPTRSDPRIDSSDPELLGTPGFAVRFRNPVVNRPGPDIVFFELQDLPGAPDGDPFHVVPMKYRSGLKPITVKAYDLTLTSPESLKLASFYLHEYDSAVASMDEFSTGKKRTPVKIQMGNNYRAIAVGIDLSALGYREGEAIEELFFQDTLDDRKHVDPVLVVGLP